MIRLVEDEGSGMELYQLKITLKYSKPPIWRRLVVRADMKLHRLHQVLQVVMGWTDSHLHQFKAGGRFYGVPDPDYAAMGTEMLNEKRYCLADLAEAGKKFVYEYDFGDGWEHDVKVEKLLPANAESKRPICLGGEKACPPEDCGGIHGYYRLLETLANPDDPEHEEMNEWIGGEWDAEYFDLDGTNAYLKRIKA